MIRTIIRQVAGISHGDLIHSSQHSMNTVLIRYVNTVREYGTNSTRMEEERKFGQRLFYANSEYLVKPRRRQDQRETVGGSRKERICLFTKTSGSIKVSLYGKGAEGNIRFNGG